MEVEKLEKRAGFANEDGNVEPKKPKPEKEEKNVPKFDSKNIDPQGFLNPIVNKDIKITKNSGIEITGTLRTITPNNQLLVYTETGTQTVYRTGIKKIELLE